MPEEESPNPPDGLETAGRQLWDSVAASFVLNAGEVEICVRRLLRLMRLCCLRRSYGGRRLGLLAMPGSRDRIRC